MGTGGDEARPGLGEREQAQGVTRGGRVEDHVVITLGRTRIADELGKLVEGGDLGGARPRELLLHRGNRHFGQDPPVGANHTPFVWDAF